MSDPIPPLAPPDPDPAGLAAHRALLRALVDGAADLAQSVATQIEDPLIQEPADAAATACARLAAAMRRGILLLRRLDDGQDPAAARQETAWQRACIARLLGAGGTIAAALAEQATRPAPHIPALAAPGAVLAYARLFTGLRRTIVLDLHLAARPLPPSRPASRGLADAAPFQTAPSQTAPSHAPRPHAALPRAALSGGLDPADRLDRPERPERLAPLPLGRHLAVIAAALALAVPCATGTARPARPARAPAPRAEALRRAARAARELRRLQRAWAPAHRAAHPPPPRPPSPAVPATAPDG